LSTSGMANICSWFLKYRFKCSYSTIILEP
jgi:hypothetical protein